MTTIENAQRLLSLVHAMRHRKPGPGFRQLEALKLGYSHLRLLGLLVTDGSLSMKDIAATLEITPPSVTALTRALINRGLVTRLPHPEDGRVALIALTNEGHALFKAIHQDQLEALGRLLNGLSLDEQELFLDLLERAVKSTLLGAPAALSQFDEGENK